MRSIQFEHLAAPKLHTYVHVMRDVQDVVTTQSIGVEGHTFGGAEEGAVYAGLVWHLTDGLRRFVVPRYWRDEVLRVAGAPYALVDWERRVDLDDLPLSVEYVPARSSVRIHPPPRPWEREYAAKAGLFEIHDPVTFRDVLAALCIDADAVLTVFAVHSLDRANALVEALRTEEAPRTEAILDPGEMVADVVIGCDLGYPDGVIVQSPGDVAAQLARTVQEFEERIRAYEARGGISTREELLTSLSFLGGIDD